MYIYINLLFGAGLFIWVIMLIPSVMLFDAPGSTNSPLTLALFISFLFYPILYFFGLAINYAIEDTKEDRSKKAKYASLPTLSIVAVVICLILIDTLCEGKLSCSL
ncbi:MAG: hypothetical protein COC09_09065 [Gammaproteobacteria bacterium]|nr:MAG: hypothetical protein COC09_09065 [Gammaproteobacteria bacterium]